MTLYAVVITNYEIRLPMHFAVPMTIKEMYAYEHLLPHKNNLKCIYMISAINNTQFICS